MRSYNQFCPIAKAAEVFCERWTALIIRELATGEARFSDIQRGVPLASPTLVSNRLKQLVKEGIVEHGVADGGGAAAYQLTEAGREFVPIVMSLGIWGQRWSRRELEEHEMDLGLLLWALEKGAQPESLGTRRRIVEFDIHDQPDHKRQWWFLNEDGHCELCVKAPDRAADVYVRARLADLIYVWRGDVEIARAIADERIEVHASRALRKAFTRWYAIAAVADVAPA